MTSLLSLLSVGSGGISADNAAVAAATNNVANANTAGYSRESVEFDSLIGPPTMSGVTVGSPTRTASELLDGQIRANNGSLQMSTQSASALSGLQSSLTAGSTIDQQLAAVFASIAQANASPTDTTQRAAVVQSLQALVSSVHDAASSVASARSSADQRIADNVTQANQLASQLAAANADVAKSGNDPTALDARDQIAQQLSALVGGQATVGSDGQMRYVLDGGAVLVDGNNAATLQTSPNATTGYNDVQVVDGGTTRDVTSEIAGGSIGADLAFRDGSGAQTANQLDQLAYDIANTFNTTSTANAALDGTTGHAMFAAPTSVTGAAAALAVDPTLASDPTKLALAAPGAGPGDDTGGEALFALSTATASGGQTLTNAALSIYDNVGTAVQTANSDVTRDQTVSDNLSSLSDSLSGVDTQEELTNLAQYQNTSSAMSKFVSTIDDMLSTFIQNLNT